uniref:Uncharacterized protein n=1 Tax=Aegilops tauschii subsp. strangulata TaxID=200361 RepID=A0A452Z4B9_AEGTS
PEPNILAKPGRVLAHGGSGQRDPSKLASSTTDGGEEDPFQIRFRHAILAGRWELQPQHPRLPSLDDAKERVSSSARRLPHYQLFPKPLPKDTHKERKKTCATETNRKGEGINAVDGLDIKLLC